MKFLEMLSRVDKKEISSKEAATFLGISIDKFYRLKKKSKIKKTYPIGIKER